MYLNSKAKQKVITGLELLIADCAVADVNLSAAFIIFMANVFLQKTRNSYLSANYIYISEIVTPPGTIF